MLDYLPENKHEWVEWDLKEAWSQTNPNVTRKLLNDLANQFEGPHPGAAASIREGLEEMLILIKLQVPELLSKTLNSTNVIGTAFSIKRDAARNVKRWQNGTQVLRWVAAGLLITVEKFYRIEGHRQLLCLRDAIEKQLKLKEDDKLGIRAFA